MAKEQGKTMGWVPGPEPWDLTNRFSSSLFHKLSHENL